MYNSDEIHKLYNEKVKLPESYFIKYAILPKCPVKQFNYSWSNRDFPRNWCILDFIDWNKKYNINIDHLAYTYTYPEYDLHNFSHNFIDQFDFFLFNQTIEHLYNPFEAIKEIYKTLKTVGYVFTSVPTINIPHMTPIHFNGYNPMGLAMLFKTCNFEIIEIGQWGNFDYIINLFHYHYWPSYDQLNKNNVVTNEERNVCQCWILARKI